MSNFTKHFFRTQHQHFVVSPKLHPCFNHLDMLKRIKAKSGTNATSSTQIMLGMSPTATGFLICSLPMTILTLSSVVCLFIILISWSIISIVATVSSIQIMGLVNKLCKSGNICFVAPAAMHPNSALAHNKKLNVISSQHSCCCLYIFVLALHCLLVTISFLMSELSAIITVSLELFLLWFWLRLLPPLPLPLDPELPLLFCSANAWPLMCFFA